MVARTRRLIADKSLVLKYCVNEQQFAYEKGIVLLSKPQMPPLSSQVGEKREIKDQRKRRTDWTLRLLRVLRAD